MRKADVAVQKVVPELMPYPLLVLGLWGVVCFALALRIFRWR